jgi:hypothetical protein
VNHPIRFNIFRQENRLYVGYLCLKFEVTNLGGYFAVQVDEALRPVDYRTLLITDGCQTGYTLFFHHERQGVAMSDNRRVYRTIREAIRQLYPQEPKGNLARHLNTLAGLISGIVQGKSCQLPNIAKNTPDAAKPESRIKRYSRWIKNECVDYDTYYFPFIRSILSGLAHIRPLVFIIDGSEVGHGCMTLMISVLYGKRALPVVWLVVKGNKGHLAEDLHVELLQQLHPIVPADSQVFFLGDGEFDGTEVQATIHGWKWLYVCRTAKNIQLYEEDIPFSFRDLCLHPGVCIGIPNVQFTRQAYGPVTAIAWWQKGYQEPIFLVTNLELVHEACYWYKKRFSIETFFSDQKSRGFFLHKSHLNDPERLSKLMLAACLAYLWMVYLGVSAHRADQIKLIHRTDRCDWSLFRLGLSLLEFLLNEGKPIPVAFNPLATKCVR